MKEKTDILLGLHLWGTPLLWPGQARQCTLSIHNTGDESVTGAVSIKVEGCIQAMSVPNATVGPRAAEQIAFTVWLPTFRPIVEKNYVTISFEGGSATFVIAAAQSAAEGGAQEEHG